MTKQLAKTGLLFAAHYLASKAERKARQAYEAHTGRQGICTCVHSENEISTQISLADYLAAWPNIAPEHHTWDNTGKGKRMAYMKYPLQFLAEFRGVKVWGFAETESVAIADLPKVEPEANTEAIAA